nr:MAG TPA: hypothetical protein [Bacteriophage sp.]
MVFVIISCFKNISHISGLTLKCRMFNMIRLEIIHHFKPLKILHL